MKRIVEYEIFESHPNYLSDKVSSSIAQGWQPLGAPVFLDHYGRQDLIQAMVKYEEVPEQVAPSQSTYVSTEKFQELRGKYYSQFFNDDTGFYELPGGIKFDDIEMTEMIDREVADYDNSRH